MDKLIYSIVVTYNGMKWIDRCLYSLLDCDTPSHILVVDNFSEDGTADYIEKKFPTVELIRSNMNIGFGKANNIGLRKALELKADYVFLLNQDAWITKNSLSKLIDVLSSRPEYGILSPLHFSASEQCFEKQFLYFLSNDNTVDFINDLYWNKIKSVYTTNYIHAAAWIISASCLQKVGGFDPIFEHYGEDDDYMRRTKYCNFLLGIVPSSSIVHDSTFKTWDLLEWNENRNLVSEYLQLKTMAPHFRSNFLFFLKKVCDELTTLVLFRKWKKFWFRLKIVIQVLMKIPKIRQSHRLSFKEGSFL